MNAVTAIAQIRSPSKVTMEQGRMIGLGLAQGILGTASLVETAAGRMAKAAPPGFGASSSAAAPSFAGSVAGGAGGVTVVNHNHNVMKLSDGSVVSMDEIGKSVRVLFVADGHRNAFATAVG